MARAWWRGRLAKEVCEATGADHGKVMDLFRVSQTYWERLVGFAVSKNSVLGDSKVRSALVWALSEHIGDETKKPLFIDNKNLKKILDGIARRSAWQELGVFLADELKQLFEREYITPIC